MLNNIDARLRQDNLPSTSPSAPGTSKQQPAPNPLPPPRKDLIYKNLREDSDEEEPRRNVAEHVVEKGSDED